jgi:thioredoxin-related protein
MERETHSNSTVIEALEANFTFIKVNTGKERQLSQKYGIIYVPTNVFTFPSGQEIGRAVGAVDPENFLNMLDQVLEFYAQNT